MGSEKTNVVADVAKPKEPNGRDRRLEINEEKSLLNTLSLSDNFWMKPLVQLAIETGMRRGELLSLKWSDVNFERKAAYLPMTRNGDSRTIPLSSSAVEVLQALPRHICDTVFPISPEALRGVWRRTIKNGANPDNYLK